MFANTRNQNQFAKNATPENTFRNTVILEEYASHAKVFVYASTRKNARDALYVWMVLAANIERFAGNV